MDAQNEKSSFSGMFCGILMFKMLILFVICVSNDSCVHKLKSYRFTQDQVL